MKYQEVKTSMKVLDIYKSKSWFFVIKIEKGGREALLGEQKTNMEDSSDSFNDEVSKQNQLQYQQYQNQQCQCQTWTWAAVQLKEDT